MAKLNWTLIDASGDIGDVFARITKSVREVLKKG
jgi:hypothetical protein